MIKEGLVNLFKELELNNRPQIRKKLCTKSTAFRRRRLRSETLSAVTAAISEKYRQWSPLMATQLVTGSRASAGTTSIKTGAIILGVVLCVLLFLTAEAVRFIHPGGSVLSLLDSQFGSVVGAILVSSLYGSYVRKLRREAIANNTFRAALDGENRTLGALSLPLLTPEPRKLDYHPIRLGLSVLIIGGYLWVWLSSLSSPNGTGAVSNASSAPPNTPRATAANNAANSTISQTGGDLGSHFGWYVDVIKRKVAQDWYLQEVEPGTPVGATVFVQFTVARDGSPSNITLATPSSSPSLNSSCLHAVPRVDTLGPLPAGYNESSLNVLYHCTFPGAR